MFVCVCECLNTHNHRQRDTSIHTCNCINFPNAPFGFCRASTVRRRPTVLFPSFIISFVYAMLLIGFETETCIICFYDLSSTKAAHHNAVMYTNNKQDNMAEWQIVSTIAWRLVYNSRLVTGGKCRTSSDSCL